MQMISIEKIPLQTMTPTGKVMIAQEQPQRQVSGLTFSLFQSLCFFYLHFPSTLV